MDVIKEENEKSEIMQYTINLLKGIIEDIQNGQCGEKEVINALNKINIPDKNAFKEDDFVNYDEIGRILCLGWNRKKINELCKKHNIKVVRFRNRPIGFRKIEILKLKEIL